jgi:hypothetical protein
MVLGKAYNNPLISLFVLSCLRRYAIWTSFRVMFKYISESAVLYVTINKYHLLSAIRRKNNVISGDKKYI